MSDENKEDEKSLSLIKNWQDQSSALLINNEKYQQINAEYNVILKDLLETTENMTNQLREINPKLTKSQLLGAMTLVAQHLYLLHQEQTPDNILRELKRVVAILPEEEEKEVLKTQEQSDKIIPFTGFEKGKTTILN